MFLKYSRSEFPFLFGGAFIEAHELANFVDSSVEFPFLFGGAFIEALTLIRLPATWLYFPSFSEGLSLRRDTPQSHPVKQIISLPFRRGFH